MTGAQRLDVELWIIGQLEPELTGPASPAFVTMHGPAGLVVRAEVDSFEGDSRDEECRGVDVEVSVGDQAIGSFGYTVSERGERKLLDRLGSGEAALITRIVDGDPGCRLEQFPLGGRSRS